jgi:hypothetical protein
LSQDPSKPLELAKEIKDTLAKINAPDFQTITEQDFTQLEREKESLKSTLEMKKQFMNEYGEQVRETLNFILQDTICNK